MSNSFVTSQAVAHQAPLSMGFPRKEYWNGLPFPFPWDLPDSGIKLESPVWQADSLCLSSQGSPGIKIPAIIRAFKWLWTHRFYFSSFVMYLLAPRFPSTGCLPRIAQEAWWLVQEHLWVARLALSLLGLRKWETPSITDCSPGRRPLLVGRRDRDETWVMANGGP